MNDNDDESWLAWLIAVLLWLVLPIVAVAALVYVLLWVL